LSYPLFIPLSEPVYRGVQKMSATSLFTVHSTPFLLHGNSHSAKPKGHPIVKSFPRNAELKLKIMKIRLGIIAIVLFGMNLVSCSKSDLTEENSLIELATEGAISPFG